MLTQTKIANLNVGGKSVFVAMEDLFLTHFLFVYLHTSDHSIVTRTPFPLCRKAVYVPLIFIMHTVADLVEIERFKFFILNI